VSTFKNLKKWSPPTMSLRHLGNGLPFKLKAYMKVGLHLYATDS